MKKIKLGFKNMKEVLSRDELKSIVGGFASGGSGPGGIQCIADDGCDSGCSQNRYCTNCCYA